MKKLFQIFFFAPIFCFAQEVNLEGAAMEKKPGKHTVYVELIGNAGTLYSVNYDYLLLNGNYLKIALRAGVSLAPYINNWDENVLSLPVEVIFIVSKKHQIEFSVGATYITSSFQDSKRYGHSVFYKSGIFITNRVFGIRFQPTKAGYFFKVLGYGFGTERISYYGGDFIWRPTEFDIIPVMGIGIGYTFKK